MRPRVRPLTKAEMKQMIEKYSAHRERKPEPWLRSTLAALAKKHSAAR